jgi:hypothetical protein
MVALVTTDLAVTGADLVARYAARWAIEVTFFDTRQTLGVGQARNRIAQAVDRTWAFGMYVHTISCSGTRHMATGPGSSPTAASTHRGTCPRRPVRCGCAGH